MKPILTTNPSLFIPKVEVFTITPKPNTNITIDGFPVITSFEWINNQSGESGFIYGNSISSFADNAKFILYDATIATYYEMIGNPTVNAD
jgi:hypothetical protein